MKRLFSVTTAIILLALLAAPALADKPVATSNGAETQWAATGCTTIQSGGILDSAGNPIQVGFDQFGYNYQAHMFNGTYDSSDRVLDGKYWGDSGDYVNDHLMMKWSDEWIANVDCNGDKHLDRGLVGTTSSDTSVGWLTNHVEGTYVDENGEEQHYTDFVKIAYTETGQLWGAYTIVQEVYNDPSAGYHGVLVLTDPGLGRYLER